MSADSEQRRGGPGWWLPVALAALFGAAGWCGSQLIEMRSSEADHAARLRGIERSLERIEQRLDTWVR
jgi:hypothetical protein